MRDIFEQTTSEVVNDEEGTTIAELERRWIQYCAALFTVRSEKKIDHPIPQTKHTLKNHTAHDIEENKQQFIE